MLSTQSARCELMDLGDEFGPGRVLEELVMYLSEDDCGDFMSHVRRMWDLDTYEDPEEDEEDD